MDRQSEKLHQDFEMLCCTIQNLGKSCIISGPIPSLSKGSECFSRLFSLHQWLRTFCLAVGITKSEFLPLTKGVPQGSVLGPVLFTIFINDIASSLNNCNVHLYADDTILYCTADTINLAIDSLQLAFNVLQESLFSLKLVLNPNKTKFMLFSRGKGIDPSVLHLKTLSGSNIEQVPVYKYLGIWIDEKLNFSSHIDCLAKQLRQKIGFFYRHKSSLPLSCRKRIIESVFMPVLDYGDIIYRNASMSSLKILDVIYHSAIRFATSASYNTHHCTLYATIGWSSLTERRFKHWIQFIYKAIIGKLPSYISLLLNCQSSAYQTRSSSYFLLTVPNARTELGKSAFCFDAPMSWNLIQRTLKLESLITFEQFKVLISNLPTPVCNCFL
ncbi:RNA-directed DNA polymerase from mobile element jockey [Merluccius polli]|uniref:RNA-directed DNA polymerase from mobile element jockey n=1 Tax=Merluccius polli TaxID=89951 RepID=A0AA47MCW8_MERPO|nr:RNA-directed DNA polymerase from mobile element jockey [Merluccius polli]